MEVYVEVYFKYDSLVMGEVVEEILWVKVVDVEIGVYELVSILFYGFVLVIVDYFEVQYDEVGKELYYQGVVCNLGNFVVVVVVVKEDFEVEQLIVELVKFNCCLEVFNVKYFVVEVFKMVFYGFVCDFLNKYEEQGVIEFVEFCFLVKYQFDLWWYKQCLFLND